MHYVSPAFRVVQKPESTEVNSVADLDRQSARGRRAVEVVRFDVRGFEVEVATV